MTRLTIAGRTDAGQNDLMVFRNKTRRGCDCFSKRTAEEIKNAIASAASEMMMVVLYGPFVERTYCRHVDLLEPTCSDQNFDVAINRRLVEGNHCAPTCFKNLGY